MSVESNAIVLNGVRMIFSEQYMVQGRSPKNCSISIGDSLANIIVDEDAGEMYRRARETYADKYESSDDMVRFEIEECRASGDSLFGAYILYRAIVADIVVEEQYAALDKKGRSIVVIASPSRLGGTTGAFTLIRKAFEEAISTSAASNDSVGQSPDQPSTETPNPKGVKTQSTSKPKKAGQKSPPINDNR